MNEIITHALQPFQKITLFEIGTFLIPFLIAVIVDIFVHRKGENITIRNALFWSCIWIGCALTYSGVLYMERGFEAATLYTTAFFVEKSLAVDNLFCFFLIFKSFGLISEKNQHFQHKILYWGIFGAIIFRACFLGLGAFIVNASHYVLMAFGVIVLWTVWKMWKNSDDDDGEEVDYSQHWSARLVGNFFKVNPSIDSGKFFKRGVTPLFICLFVIEVCDIIFAFDSLPAVLAITSDYLIVITASLWAAAGLRSLYFLLVAAQNKLWALDKAVMALLGFIGFKLIGSGFGLHISNIASLSVVAISLLSGVLVSLFVEEPIKSEN